MKKIDQDYFEDWQSHPLTQLLFKRCRQWADEKKQYWVELSWDGGNHDPMALARLREVARTLEDVASVTREQLEEDSE